MDEYIEREALVHRLKSPYLFNITQRIFEIISEIPAADVSPVVHGRWENGNPICPVCGENKFKDLDADIWCDWQPDFCPNCGALMDGAEE
mgnify:CR=1 FL=1